jgi:hypothetical protein
VEAADDPVSGDDGDALGDDARVVEAADDPVGGDDGDALSGDARTEATADDPTAALTAAFARRRLRMTRTAALSTTCTAAMRT